MSDEKKVVYQKGQKHKASQTNYSGELMIHGKRKKQILKALNEHCAAPKKPTSAYLFYQKFRRETLKVEQPELKNTEMMGKMAEEWKQLTLEEKQRYEKMAVEDKQRYEKQFKDFTESGTYEGQDADIEERNKKRKSTAKDPRGTKKRKKDKELGDALKDALTPKEEEDEDVHLKFGGAMAGAMTSVLKKDEDLHEDVEVEADTSHLVDPEHDGGLHQDLGDNVVANHLGGEFGDSVLHEGEMDDVIMKLGV